MPVHKIPGGYQYGTTGKHYYGKDAKKKAEKQALAIRLSGYEEANSSRSDAPTKRSIKRTTNQNTEQSTSFPLSSGLVSLGRAFVTRLFRKDH